MDDSFTWLNHNFLVTDFEFTTFSGTFGRPRAFFPEIIEVGAVLIAPPEYNLETTYQAFVRPRFFPRLTDTCKEIAIIKQQDVDNGIEYEAMLNKLAEYYQAGRTYFVTWGDTDRKVIDTACRRYGIEGPFDWNDYVDLSDEYRHFFKVEKRRSLRNAVMEQGLETVGYWHMALNDALNTGVLLMDMVYKGWRPGQTTSECQEASKRPGYYELRREKNSP